MTESSFVRRLLLLAIPLACATPGCRERLPETPKLAQARALNQAGGPQSARVRRVGASADVLKKALKGGKLVFKDDFERESFGPNWKAELPEWKLQDGEVVNHFAENKGLWLLEKLPDGDVRIEYDARSDPYEKREKSGAVREEFPGDLKCEAFNRLPEHQTGYVFIFGGWQNRINRIARLEEHGNGEGAEVVDGPPFPVEKSKKYRMKVLRVGSTVAFYADDTLLGQFTDGDFIEGRHFGFNNWQAHVTFDNVAVYALEPAPAPAPATAPKKANEPTGAPTGAPVTGPNILTN